MAEQQGITRIAYLTRGAANMFCGSCLHDNTLARAWNQQGVDALLVPTYTPIRTDEEDVSVDQVFFGGINVYLQQKIFVFRYLPAFLDRFLDNNCKPLDRYFYFIEVIDEKIDSNLANGDISNQIKLDL